MNDAEKSLDPTSSDDFRQVMGRIPTAVAVISAMNEGTPVGVVVGSLVSVSIKPPLVGFFIAKTSTTWPLIAPRRTFCASILAADQERACRAFATRGTDKFAQCSWTTSPSGSPRINDAVAWMDCGIEAIVPAGDHDLILGRIRWMEASSAEPLVFLGGIYGRFASDEPGAFGRGVA